MSELKLTADQVTSIDPEKGMTSVQETLDKFLATADVNVVYGKPIKSGDMLIIPAAEVVCGMGFGMGFGYGTSSSAGEEAENENKADKAEEEKPETPPGEGYGSGGGGGGGGYTFSRPVALVIATPEGIRVEPVLDRTKILLAALTTAGFMVSMIAGMMKGRR
jgi:uncharacterized spore protein YtfJ